METQDNATVQQFLKTVDTSSLVDKVEANLIQYFKKQALQPGDLIPKETELAKAMGVSRTVIRESMNRLKTIGMVESIKHKGTIIKSPDLSGLIGKSLIPHILDPNALQDIFELRLVIEIGMGDLVCEHVTDEDIRELEEIVNEEPEASKDILFDVAHEIRFHSKLYEITKNDTLKSFQQILLPVFQYVYDSGLIHKPIRNERYISHKGLVEVLKRRDPDDFRIAMRKHLENHFRRIFELKQSDRQEGEDEPDRR